MRVFVTGTDTEIGKTLVSATLALGWNAHYWKPVQSGTSPSTDSRDLSAWIGSERVLPERHVLTQPLSPNQSAERDGVRVALGDFTLPTVAGSLIVEGAGGLLVPLNERELMIDLIAQLGLPTILVARSGLGTLNHSLLSLEALRARGIRCAGVIMSGEPHPDNKRDIAHFGQTRILGEIPHLVSTGPDDLRRVFTSFDPDLRSGDLLK